MTAVPAGSLAAVLSSACALLGVPGTSDELGLAERVGEVRQVVVLLLDGLGHRLLPAAAGHSPVLADVLAGRLGRLDELASAFPSTTPTSLVTLGTGVLPGQHGVLGFTVNVPGTDRVLVHVNWRDDPPPQQWQPVPSLFSRAAAAGVSGSIVARAEFAGSGLSLAAYGPARYVAAADTAELAGGIAAELARGTRLVYGYHPSVDTVAHLHGIASTEWGRAVAAAGRLIERVAAELPAGSALLVTADHGAVDVPAAARVDLATDPRLAAGLRVVAGEPRVRYLHTQPGAAEDVLAAWRDVLGGRALVLPREQAVAEGWFGPVRAQNLARIGDVVVICRDDTIVLAGGYEPDTVRQLIAFHGSATPAETAIPLLTIRPG